MDWEDSIYKCSDCDKPIDAKSQNAKRNKSKERLRKFKDYEE
jgi:DNA-directed RNA polymerase subunit RPC12/RpoP